MGIMKKNAALRHANYGRCFVWLVACRDFRTRKKSAGMASRSFVLLPPTPNAEINSKSMCLMTLSIYASPMPLVYKVHQGLMRFGQSYACLCSFYAREFVLRLTWFVRKTAMPICLIAHLCCPEQNMAMTLIEKCLGDHCPRTFSTTRKHLAFPHPVGTSCHFLYRSHGDQFWRFIASSCHREKRLELVTFCSLT